MANEKIKKLPNGQWECIIDENEKIVPENSEFRKKVLETRFVGGDFKHQWVPCRPLPETDGWFETVWADYRTGKVYENK